MKTGSSTFPIYGLTGGIASGKSAAAGFLRTFGVEVIDADAIARELRAPGGAAESPILKEFGTLDPALLREKIASSRDAKKKLESILHPMIEVESRKRFAALATRASPGGFVGTTYAVYEAALLVEAGRSADFAGVVLIESSAAIRLARLVERDGMGIESARQFLGAQGPVEVKRAASTHHIQNDGTLDELREKISRLHAALLSGEKTFSA